MRTRLRRAAVAIAAICASVACGSSSSVATGPTPVKCQVSLQTTATAIDPNGGTGTVSVTAQPECTWTASSEVNWVTGLNPSSGQGSGQIGFQALPNPLPGPRQADIVVNNGRVSVRQEAALCHFDVTPLSHALPSTGGTASVNVTTSSGCAWTANSEAGWIAVTGGVSGNSSGTVTFSVNSNLTGERTGSLVIAGQTVTVRQQASGAERCPVVLAPTSQLIGVAGGNGAPITVSTAAGCDWTAISNADWITITSGASGGSSGVVGFRVAANSGGGRSGTITIGGSLFTVTQAGGTPCSYAIAPRGQTVVAAGATGAITVTAGATCSWTAITTTPWISITSGASGTGNASVGFSVAANTGAARAGTLTIAGEVFTIDQAAGQVPACEYTILPTSESLAATAGPGSPVNVSTASGCAWTTTSNASWITVTSGANGSGNGAVGFNVTANTGAARTGTLTIAGNTFSVNQAAGTSTCAYSVNPTTQSVAASAGAGSPVSVSTSSGCTWTAGSNDSWITITSGTSGSGSGAVGFAVTANTGGARSGTLTVAGETVTINQAAGSSSGCAFSITPSSESVAAAAGAGSPVNVSTTSGCTWTATSNASWISVTSGASGSGDGSVAYSVAANTGAARSGTLTIAGQTFTVNQAAAGGGACAYSITPSSQSAAAAAGPGSPVTVSTNSGCNWTASSNASWLSITSGSSGSGPGAVEFNVAANTGAARSGTLTVAGQTFTVNQAAPPAASCVYSINPTSQSLDASAAAGNPVSVSTSNGCGWTAASNASWISITSGASGSGNGSVGFSVTANPGAARSGTMIIAGRTFTVNQAAPACSYSINPTSHPAPAAGGAAGPITVTTSSGCTWSAASHAPWITITSGASGTGNGGVEFNVAPNTGGARSGTLTIADQTFTVNQAAAVAPCSYSINPTGHSASAAGGAGGPVTVSSNSGCGWTAASNVSWVTITSGASGSGNGSVQFNVAANTGVARAGTLTIAGQPFSVNQEAAAVPCSYSINPNSQLFSSSGGAGGPVAVSANSGCGWTAASNASWITITSGASGNGNGSVVFSVAANTGAARSGTLTIAGQTFTVNQDAAVAPCAYSINPRTQSFTPTGGAGGPVVVSTTSGCGWTAASNASWIAITSGASGNGSGSVEFSVASNTGAARSGTLTIAGQTFNVDQAAAVLPCSYSISPTGQPMPSNGGSGGPVNVTTNSGCGWTAASNATWLTITSGATGSGSGSVQFSAAANPGAARSGTLTIAGQTFTVDQAAAVVPCSYTIAPSSQSVVSTGGAGGPVTVSTPSGCTWTAASNESWITITSGASGSGSGSVEFSVAATPGPARNGTLTIAGQTFTVHQAAAPPACSYTINPTSLTVPATSGGGNTVSVSTTGGCAWTATSNATWLTVTAGASGSGNGTVTFAVAENQSGLERIGTLTIAGETLTVRQQR